MNRNQESHFSLLPQVNVSRSKMDTSRRHLTSFNVGDLVPVFLDEVLPGDTFQVDTNKLVRMQPLVAPVMDNLYLDTYYFFVPNRLVWEHWENLMGENTESAWLPTVEYSVPQVSPPSGGWTQGTIADHMGIPTKVAGFTVSALPFRAYALIANEWFRDENLTDPLVISKGDANVSGSNGTDYRTDVEKGGMPFKAAKFHDYFTSALPSPQKGPEVNINLGNLGDFPVVPLTTTHETPNNPILFSNGTSETLANTFRLNAMTNGGNAVYYSYSNNNATVHPVNLWAQVPESATVMTINQLRQAFAVQTLFERDARGGSRYTEILRSHFGVISPDSRLQRPEYLGGNRIHINIAQTIQTSATGDGTPQGHAAAYSVTSDHHSDFTHSFTEHGYIIGVCVARYDHTYQQGLHRMWTRKDRFDYYWPVFAHLGEQAIKTQEIYAGAQPTQIFGYQEAWAEYRYGVNSVSGQMRSNATGTLNIWHFADNYTSAPTLSDGWIREDKSPVDRALSVSSSVSDQLFGDFYFRVQATRPMPVYSIPGLLGHM